MRRVRARFALMAVLLLVGTMTGCFSASAFADDATASSSSSESVETVRVDVCPYPGYVYQDANGIWTGVDIEYIENIAQHAGFQVEFVQNSNAAEAFSMLDNGDVDIVSDAAWTDERAQRYIFSEDAQGSSGSSIIMRADDNRCSYGDIDKLSTLTYAVEKSSVVGTIFSDWCSNHGFAPATVEYDSLSDQMAALDSGAVDAIVLGTPYLDGYRTVQTFAPTPYYFLFRSSDIVLKNKVDAAMEQILTEDPLYVQMLLEKYGVSGQNKTISLTAEETEYIETHPTITVAVLDDDEPYFSRASDGTPKGVLPDLYAEISNQTGLHFDYASYRTQNEAIAAVTSGDADVLGIYSDGLPNAYNTGLELTVQYTTVTTVMVTSVNTDAADIKTVAVKQRSLNAVRENVAESLPDTQIVGYDTAATCFEALEDRKVDAVIIGLPSATWLVNQTNSSAYRIAPFSSSNLELCAAIVYGNNTLCSILNKAINVVSSNSDGIIANNTLAENNWRTAISRVSPTTIAIVAAILVAMVIALILALISFAHRQREKASIAALKAANEHRELEIAARERSAEERNEFFSNISHDMRTPLNAIVGFAGLAKGTDNVAVKDGYIDKIEISSGLLNNLIDDTLDISKMNSGKYALKLSRVDTDEVTEAIVVPIRAAAEQRGQNFVVDDAGLRRRWIMADRLSVQKIFLNLLSNAVKYTPEGGTITLAVADDPRDAAEPDTLVKVSDTGIGMSAEYLPHIYEPFTQEDRSDASSKGTGLGLSIVRQLVDLMGGTIDVESAVGAGTTFTVHLHFANAPAAGCAPANAQNDALAAQGDAVKAAGSNAAASAKDADAADANAKDANATDADSTGAGARRGDRHSREQSKVTLAGRRILLVEDNEMNAEIARTLLEHAGITVDCAADGAAGVKAFEDAAPGTFDAILMDIRMPIMDGYEATRKIRALDRSDAGSVPIIAMTADAYADDVQRCLDAGMNAHVAKPINPDRLIGTIAQLCR